MLTQNQAIFFQVLTIIVILLSPVIAVGVTLWHQTRKEKRSAKINLFLTLIATRRSSVDSQNFVNRVNALNSIDVVFHDEQSIVTLWHQYYSLLYYSGQEPMQKEVDHKWLDLLDTMGRSLGYDNLRQTDLDKFYSPRGWDEMSNRNYETQIELLRVLKGTKSLHAKQIEEKN